MTEEDIIFDKREIPEINRKIIHQKETVKTYWEEQK